MSDSKPSLTHVSDYDNEIMILKLFSGAMSRDHGYWDWDVNGEYSWKKDFSLIFNGVFIPMEDCIPDPPFQRPSMLFLEDDFQECLAKVDLDEITSILTLGKMKFYKLYVCPKCRSMQDIADKRLIFDPDSDKEWEGIHNTEPLPCMKCGTDSYPTVFLVHPRERVKYYVEDQTLKRIDLWLMEHGVKKENTIVGSARWGESRLEMNWNALIDTGRDWMNMPNDLLFNLIFYSRVDVINGIINGERGIHVFYPKYLYEREEKIKAYFENYKL